MNPSVWQALEGATVFSGSSSTMSVQLINPNNADLFGITFTDNMPTGMIVASPVTSSVGTCGGTITATSGNNFFTFSGGSIPPFTSCTLTISITMTVNGNLTNTIPAGSVTTQNGASNPQPAETSLTNLPGAVVSKAFSPNPINAAEFSLLTITIQNTGNIGLTGMGLSDILPGNLPAGLSIAGAPAPVPVNNCGGRCPAPPSTGLADGDGIPIEERAATEVTHIQGQAEDGSVTSVRLTPAQSGAANPAFDVTPARLVTAIITERGICPATREGLLGLYPESRAGKLQHERIQTPRRPRRHGQTNRRAGPQQGFFRQCQRQVSRRLSRHPHRPA